MGSRYQLVEDAFPLLVSVTPTTFDKDSIAELCKRYEENFARERRYGLLTYTPPVAGSPSARDRLAIAAWANDPKIRALTKRWCVAAATYVPGALERGALTAILWVWQPPQPHLACATAAEGVDFCLDHLERAQIALPETRAVLRRRALDVVAAAAP